MAKVAAKAGGKGLKKVPRVGKKLMKIGKNKKVKKGVGGQVKKLAKRQAKKEVKKAGTRIVKHQVKEHVDVDKDGIKVLALQQEQKIGKKIWNLGEKSRPETEEAEEEEFAPPSIGLCSICLMEDAPLISLTCTHEICIPCAQKYLQEQIENLHEFVFPCPADTECKELMSHNLVCQLLSRRQHRIYFENVTGKLGLRELLDQYNYLMLAVAMHKEDEFVWCPYSDCHWAVLRGPNRGNCPYITCRICLNEFCSFCQTPSHPGIPCRFWGDAAEMYPKLVKKCPKCKIPQQRNLMWCHYVRCGDEKCRCKFCWCCGQEVSSFKHFTNRATMERCHMAYNDIWIGLWPLRLCLDLPFFAHWFIWFFLLPPTLVAVFYYVLFSFPIWWTRRLWHKQKKWGIPCCCRVMFSMPVFCCFFVYGFFLAVIADLFTLALFNIYCMLNCPCIPFSGAVRTTMRILGCIFSFLGMFPELVELFKQVRESVKEVEAGRFEEGEEYEEETFRERLNEHTEEVDEELEPWEEVTGEKPLEEVSENGEMRTAEIPSEIKEARSGMNTAMEDMGEQAEETNQGPNMKTAELPDEEYS